MFLYRAVLRTDLGDFSAVRAVRRRHLPTVLSRAEVTALLDRLEAYGAFAAQRGRTIGELAIAWLLAQRSVTSVIAGATRPDQVAANAAAATWVLSAEEAAEVAAL